MGDSGTAANVEQRQLKSIYSQAVKDAYEIFHAETLFDGVKNVAYLNQHPNETVEIPEALYQAFALLQKYENRALYLGPIYQEYVGMFLGGSDEVAQQYDPDKNAEQGVYFAELLTFTGDENVIALELLGENRVVLHISQEYLEYAQAQQITCFVDFYWMKNAFVVDYLAQQVIAAGFTKGTISSFDGFTRNLDGDARGYSINIFDRKGQERYKAGTLQNIRATASVALRNYPASELAVQLYYGWGDGSVTSCHIDPADGRSKSAINDLTAYSQSLNCGEILMQVYALYVADALDTAALQQLPSKEIQTVYCDGYGIRTSDSQAQVTDLYRKDNIQYTWQKAD